MRALTELTGVGPALAKAMQAHGIRSVETVAQLSIEELNKVPGIGVARAAGLKELATAWIGIAPSTAGSGGKPGAANALAAPEETTATAMAKAASDGDGQLNAALIAAEAARLAAEEKAAKAKIKARKAAKKAEALALEVTEARAKAKEKAKRVKAKARKAIEREKAKAKAILELKTAAAKADVPDKPAKKKKAKKQKP